MKKFLLALAIGLAPLLAFPQVTNPPTWNPPQPPIFIGSTGQVLAVQSSGRLAFQATPIPTNPTLQGFILNNPTLALNQKNTSFSNGTVAGSLATNICAATDAGVLASTDCLQLLRGAGATFSGFLYFDSLGNNFSFTGNDLVVNEPTHNPLLISEDSSSGDFTGDLALLDSGSNEVSGGFVCVGRTNAFGAQFNGGAGASGPDCAFGTNSVIMNQGGSIVVPTSIGANANVFLEGDGSTYTDMWVGPTPVKNWHSTYTAGVVATTVGSSANGSNVTNIVGGSAANTQVNGKQIANTQSGTFTITYTGMTASVTGTAVWTLTGNIAVLYFPAATGTSNATSFTATGLPATIQPARTQQNEIADFAIENNSSVGGITTDAEVIFTASSGTITFLNGGNSTGWTNTGTKGIANATSVTYLIN